MENHTKDGSLPTAEEFMNKAPSNMKPSQMMIEFAKMHVKAALEAAAENSVKMSSTKATIRNCYPEDLIK